MKSNIVYETHGGVFLQDDPLAQPVSIGAIPPRFGLLNNGPDRWIKFKEEISQLHAGREADTEYKVFFLGRHGQGFHNVAEAKYGTKSWDDYWSKLNGDGDLIWGPDPDLTEVGEAQAVAAHSEWIAELPFGIPLPQKMYCSPLTRAIRTNILTFDGVLGNSEYNPVVLENCREEYGEHTCDMRRTRSYILSKFPGFEVEHGFSEADELWTEARESKENTAYRARLVLDKVFHDDSEPYISITSHGGFINAFLAVIGRPSYALPTGGVLPVVVKRTQI